MPKVSADLPVPSSCSPVSGTGSQRNQCLDPDLFRSRGRGARESFTAAPPGRLAAEALGPHISRGPLTTNQPPMTEETVAETRTFQAEVSRLLDIVAHSLYSEKEIFLRELISNASDACDRLRYAALTQPRLAERDANYRGVLTPVKSSRTLTVADNGIGMNHDELVENLGTIARSATAAFMNELNGGDA